MTSAKPKAAPARPPKIRVRKRVEREVQSECVNLARDAGWVGTKLVDNNDWPDYLFMTGYRAAPVILVEFKRPGEKPRDGQEKAHERLYLKYYLTVYTVDSVAAFRLLLAAYPCTFNLDRSP